MKKKIIIAICAVVVVIAAIIGGIAIHDNNVAKTVKECVIACDKTIELDNQSHNIKADELISANAPINVNGGKSIECRFYFENNQESINITADKVQEENTKIIVNLVDCILFDQSFTLDSKIQIIDTTAPEFTKSIDEIKITEGDEINILDNFSTEDLSRDVQIKIDGEINTSEAGEQTVKIIAIDGSGNKTEHDVKIIIEKKPESAVQTQNKQQSSNSNSKSNNNSSKSSSSKISSSSNSSNNNSGGSSNSNNSAEKENEKIDASAIQKEINAYIASKGWEVNSSLTPSNAGWSRRISCNQSQSNIIKSLKYDVDEFPPSFGKYCYFDGQYFYVLYD